MSRQVTCKYCKSKGSSLEMYKIPTNIECTRFEYYCDENEYKQLKDVLEQKKLLKEAKKLEKELMLAEKKKRTEEYNDLMKYVMQELLEYEKGMVFPTILVKRIQELAKFYSYILIKQAFYKNSDTIKWALKTYSHFTEYQMMSYIMKVVEGNINDLYKQNKEHDKVRERIEKEMKSKESKIDAEIYHEVVEEVKYVKKENKSIQSFLDDDDLL